MTADIPVHAQIPLHAQERLKGLRSSAHSTGVFTSDFSVNEFLLVRKAGFEPIGLCVGTCVYHVGIQYGAWSKNQELDVLSKAMYHARELAMSRMRAEATAMGADGIVGVKLTIKRLEWTSISWSSSPSALAWCMATAIRVFAPMTAVRSPQTCRGRISIAAPFRLSSGRDGDGKLRLSRRSSRHVVGARHHRP